jgi:hypothetical protein
MAPATGKLEDVARVADKNLQTRDNLVLSRNIITLPAGPGNYCSSIHRVTSRLNGALVRLAPSKEDLYAA